MLVGFGKKTGQKHAQWLNCTVSWSVSPTQTVGELSCMIPRSSRWFTEGYMSELQNGGFLVKGSHGQLGEWIGIADKPQLDASGAHIHALQFETAVSYRVVRQRVLKNMTAGAIARAAFRDAFCGLGSLGMAEGSFVEGSPQFTEYRFSGQSFGQVLNDLNAQTGQEWVIDGGIKFSWVAPSGTVQIRKLVQGSNIVNVQRSGDTAERVSSVIARNSDGRSFRSDAPETFGNILQRQVSISSDASDTIGLGLDAVHAINQSRAEVVKYTFDLHSSLWSVIREGDYVQLVLPYFGSRGEFPVCRIASRSWHSTDSRLSVECHTITPFTLNKSISFGASRVEYGIYVPRTYDAAKLLVDTTNKVYDLSTRTVT